MIVELQKGAEKLAKNEREGAWREMARQIAHEIKNPLTPMKLSIQYLQRAIKEQPERALELTPRVAATLIEQIDNLSEIATAFSSFAKMPKTEREIISLPPIIDNVVDLFDAENLTIQKIYEAENIEVFADKNQMISVFNNLLKNAVQATETKNDRKITIEIKKEKQHVIISIKDNGVGIAKEMENKIFTPNFTTKSSGTGLGLAISKQMIENSDGEIWFNSKEHEGTTFYVKLPFVK
jgi:nitrogen fixation/metabolism regulation signal transduction histidine kinase